MKRLALLLFMFSTVAFSQRGFKDSNRIGIGAGLTQMNIYTDNFTITPETGWIGGLSVRGNYYNNWQMSFGMFFTDSNFSIPTLKGLQQTQTNFKMSAVQIYLVPSYVFVEHHLNLEFGPVLQVNGKLGLDKNDETNLLLDQPGLVAKDIVDVSKINANFYVGINGGFKNVRARIGYQYGLTNFFGNLKNNDNVKLLGEKMKGNIGLISGQLTIYL
ncbi:PorT family protein [Flavobacterium channae]|uniref:PorT family protein n=1 Tax=Flavobacterium channae TaxID=2897181 RepID=UPI001E4CB88D|nr:PorT family protein [Flavobacterium channae]UGS23681.1 PorT family protein [Flavobacterium channae]